MRRALGYAAVGVIALFAVGACSSEGGGSSSAGANLAARAPAAPAASAAGSAAGSAERGATVADQAAPLATADARIRTAELTIAIRGADRVATRADQADAIATRAGGEVDADDRTGGKHAQASLQLRVPPSTLPAALTALSGLGTVKTRQLATSDVTEQVADVGSRVASAQAAITRLRTLYGHAVKVADVIAVESELSTRESNLESLEAQQRVLARQTSMATINLTLETAAPAATPARRPGHHGFVGGLQRGWDGFTATAAWVAQALATILPFLIVILLIGLGGRRLWPRLAARRG